MNTNHSTRERPHRWAPPVPPERLRALYRSLRGGAVDEDLLLEVGWALWARARDVAAVSTAVHTGRVACAACGGEAQRTRRLAYAPGGAPRPVSCAHCGYEGDWSDVRDAMRRRPRCLACGVPMAWRYAETELHCPGCSVQITFKEWLRRMGQRATLPCPRCLEPLRRPAPQPHPASQLRTPSPQAVTCDHCGETHTEAALRAHWRSHPRCPCGASLVATEGGLRCETCGRELTRGKFSELLARRRSGPCPSCGQRIGRPRDVVRCQSCGDERPWSHYRRAWQGRKLMTGAGVPVCEQFVARWPGFVSTQEQIIAVDSFIHELHFGPLAPLLVGGDRAAVLQLLDELGDG